MSASWQDDPFAFDDLSDDGHNQAEPGGAPAKKGKHRLTDRGVAALSVTNRRRGP